MSAGIINPPNQAYEQVIKDFEKFVFNYLTGKLDLSLAFNTDRIVTHECNAAGQPLTVYNVASNSQIPSDSGIVTDNLGNIVVLGAGANIY